MDILDLRLRQLKHRWLTQKRLDHLGWLGLLSLVVALMVCLADRLLSLHLSSWVYLPIAGLPWLLAMVLPWLQQPTREQLARRLDAQVGLKDGVSTALFVSQLKPDDFTRFTVAQAQERARSLNIRQAFPLTSSRSWAGWPVLGGVLALTWFMLPAMDLLGLAQQRQQQAQQELEEATVQEQIVQTVAAMRELEVPRLSASELSNEEALRNLAELSREDLRNPESRRLAIEQLEDLQRQLQRSTEEKQQQVQSIQNAMSQLETKQNGPADEFADALRRGDYQAAQRAMQKLADQLEQLSPEQREAAQQQLEQLAQQLNQLAQQQQAQSQQTQQQIQQALQQAGMSQQQIQQLQQQGMNAQSVQQALQQQGMNPQQAQQLAQQIQQQNQQSQNSSQNAQQMQQLAQNTQQMGQCAGGQCATTQPSSFGVNQSLSQLAQMQQQLQQMQQGQQQAQQAMQNMSQPGQGGNCNNPGQAGQSGQPNPSGGSANANSSNGPSPAGGQKSSSPSLTGGGQKAGVGHGGNPLGQERQLTGYQTENLSHLDQSQGRVIASWLSEGQVAKGEAQLEFNQAVTQARSQAEQAVSEDRVPRRYHGAVHEYFNQLPQNVDEVRTPKAPR